MQSITGIISLTQSVNLKTLRIFVKNLDAPRCVAYRDVGQGREQDALSFIVFVKGMAINCKRCLAGHAEIIHKNPSNCGF